MITTTVEQQWNGKDIKIRGKRVVGKSAFEIGLIVEGQAKLRAPVRTGRLSGSITTQASDHGTEPSGMGAVGSDKIHPPEDENEVLVGTPVDYGPYQEFGTVHSHAQPFLRPALALARGQELTVTMKHGRHEFAEYLK